jgi:hypothetical protein
MHTLLADGVSVSAGRLSERAEGNDTPQADALAALGGAKRGEQQIVALGQWQLHVQRLEKEDALLPSTQLLLRRWRWQ